MKKCTKCGIEKLLSDFGTRKRNSTGKRGTCKDCEKKYRDVFLSNPINKSKYNKYAMQYYWNNREKMLKRQDIWRRANKEHRFNYQRGRSLLKNYRMTQIQYDAMALAQGNKCKICNSEKPGHNSKYFYVDHCHKTNKVRGLLCTHCNMAIGQFSDNSESMRRAALYVDMQGEI